MDILFVSRCSPNVPASGDALILDQLTRQLASRGHRLELLAFSLDGIESAAGEGGDVFDHLEVVGERARSYLDYGIRPAHLFLDSAAQCWNPDMWAAIERRLDLQRFDVVHFFGGVQVYEYRNLTATLPKIIVPYECSSRALERDLAGTKGWLPWLRLTVRLRGTRWYESRIYAGFQRVVVLTEADSSAFRRLVPAMPTVVIPNGVDVEFFRPRGGPPRKPTLTFVGNFTYPPNLRAARELVEEILPLVTAEVPSACAVLVGPDLPAKRMARAGPNVEIAGFVPDIRPYLEASTCFVSPLRGGSGLRNKILEAMAAGLPVVATPVSCEGIEVTDGENVLLGRTSRELADAAIRLIRDGSLRLRISEAGRRLMRQRYTWDSVADQYEALYRSVISERAGA